jgi:polyhydroxybutyrate depolymerase
MTYGRAAAAIAAAFAITGAPAASQPPDAAIAALGLDHGGVRREAVMIRPARLETAAPLVIMLAGDGATARAVLAGSGWARQADQSGFVAVALEALPARPDRPAGRSNPRRWADGDPAHLPTANDDVGFVAAALEAVAARAAIDRQRVFLAGFSDGGAMAMRAGAALAGRVRAVGAVDAHWWTPVDRLAAPVSLVLLVGTADPLNPWAGGPVRDARGRLTQRPHFLDSAAAWARAVGCPRGPAASRGYPQEIFSWADCPAGSRVLMRTRSGLGHAWPADAAAQIWRLFAESAADSGGR